METLEKITMEHYDNILESFSNENAAWKKLYEAAASQIDIMTDILSEADKRMKELEKQNKELLEKLEKVDK